MPAVHWTDDLSVGIDDIDADHRHFIGLVNRFGVGRRRGLARVELQTLLADLVTHIEEHFHREEQVMADSGYPAAAAHQRLHDEAAARIHDLYLSQPSDAEMEAFLKGFLFAWFEEHVRTADQAFGDWIRTRREPSPAGVPAAFAPSTRSHGTETAAMHEQHS